MRTTARTPTQFGRTQPPDHQWLSKGIAEAPLDPEIPIVDAHVHLWHHTSGHTYFVPEYADDIEESGHAISASVYVECSSMYRAGGPPALRAVGETEFATGMAAMAASERYTTTRVAAAVVAYADLRDPAVDVVLDAHAAAANGRLRGIRNRAKWDPDPAVRGPVSADSPGLYLDPEFQAGVAGLATRGLSFEASIFHPQLAEVRSLAQSAPDVQIVLGHTGSPVAHSSYAGRREEELAKWTADMLDLSRLPNVTVKIGGLLMSQGTFDFRHVESPPSSELLVTLWRPFIQGAIEIFGPERCMVGSNFPVEKAGCTYGTFWNTIKRILAGYSDSDKHAVLHGTAEELYSL